MTSAIKINKLSAVIDGKIILNDVSLSLGQGKVGVIIGPSGAGKTTLLRCLNLLSNFSEGGIEIAGINLSSHTSSIEKSILRKKVGMVFQNLNLWPHKTILDNLTLAPIIVNKINKKEAEKKATELLSVVGLVEKVSDYPINLSGGEQQRVAIARALMMGPGILLLDEVTSALDPELTLGVLDAIQELVKKERRTFLIVTHELGFAKNIADEVFFMDKGKIIEQGSPEQIFTNPMTERLKEFIGKFRSSL